MFLQIATAAAAVGTFFPATDTDVQQHCKLGPALTEPGVLSLWQDYAAFHKKELAGKGPRVLRFVAPSTSGLGDQMRGAAGALYLAMRTKRALLLSDHSHGLKSYGLVPRFIDWDADPKQPGEAIDENYNLRGAAFGDPWTSQMQNKLPRSNSSKLTALDIIDALTNDETKDVTLNSNYFAQFLLPEELSILMSNSEAAHEDHAFDGVRARAMGCAFHYLAKPSERLYASMLKFRRSVGLGRTEIPSLAVHARFGDFIAWKIVGSMMTYKTGRDVRLKASQNNTNAMVDCAYKLQQSTPSSSGCSILFSSDWSQARRWALDYGKQKRFSRSCAIHASPDQVQHTAAFAAMKEMDAARNEDSVDDDNTRATSALAEVMVMASSQNLLLSHSGFGFTARAIALRPQSTVHSLADECGAVQTKENSLYDLSQPERFVPLTRPSA